MEQFTPVKHGSIVQGMATGVRPQHEQPALYTDAEVALGTGGRPKAARWLWARCEQRHSNKMFQ